MIVAGAAALLLAAFYLKTADDKFGSQVNSVQGVETVIADKTLETKTQAYDALANEKENFYNRPAEAFRSSPQTLVPQPAGSPTPLPKQDRKQDAQFEQAYKEVEQNLRGIYEDATPAAVVAGQTRHQIADVDEVNVAPETTEERRRKAMLQDWGMNKSNNAAVENTDQLSMCRAVIHGTQVVRVGQTALFRTKEQIRYQGLTIPANTLLSGLVSASRDRLSIRINSVRLNNEVFSLPLEVYGSDGIAGIPLNYNQAGQIADQQVSSTAIQETSAAVSRYGGTIGRVAGAVMSGVGNQVKSAKSQEVTLIDNQSILLKIIQQ